MEDYVCTVVEDEKNVEDDVIITINDWYNCSDSCSYVLPDKIQPEFYYTVVKETKVEDSDIFYTVDYAQ